MIFVTRASKVFAKVGVKRPGVDAENCRRHLRTKRNYRQNRVTPRTRVPRSAIPIFIWR